MTIGTSCKKCYWAKNITPKDEKDWTGLCTLNPPTPVIMMIPGPPDILKPGQPTMQPSVQGIRPPVTEPDTCGQHHQKLDS